MKKQKSKLGWWQDISYTSTLILEAKAGDLCDFKASLVYRVRPCVKTKQLGYHKN